MMARMVTQVPLPLTPGDAVEIAAGVGLVAGTEGGEVWVHGLVTFAWDGGDEAGRRLAAVQLRKLKAATQAQVADACGVIPVSVWRWEKALAAGGVAGLVPARKGPRRASKLTAEVMARIGEASGKGTSAARIAAAEGVSESSVRNALRPARPAAAAGDPAAGGADGGPAGGGDAAGPGPAGGEQGQGVSAGGGGPPPGLPEPVARGGGRAAARLRLLGRGCG